MIKKSVTVITPTIGLSKLLDCVISVQNQTYPNITHLIVVDGPEYFNEHISNILNKNIKNVIITTTPYNTGENKYYGQKIYAAYSHLVKSDYVFFLDEDNWYDSNHVESMVNLIEDEDLDWAYSLRNIYSIDKKFITEDNCESLGKWPIYSTHNDPQYLVDTSCYAFRKEFIKNTSHYWESNRFRSEDKSYFYAVKDSSKWNTTKLYTLSYRLGGNANSVTYDFFVQGNSAQLRIYNGKLPWKKI
jgi:Glycosyl transferase family 2